MHAAQSHFPDSDPVQNNKSHQLLSEPIAMRAADLSFAPPWCEKVAESLGLSET
jgi:hypothetical protein